MKSKKPIKQLSEIIKEFEIIFPITIEGSVNTDSFSFKKGEKVKLTYPQYEAINHSDYAKYLT